jgi:hypothetical protein
MEMIMTCLVLYWMQYVTKATVEYSSGFEWDIGDDNWNTKRSTAVRFELTRVAPLT